MKITIITVTFNEAKKIRKTIESVLNQTSNEIEYIICDGKSTDETVEIANSYKEPFAARGIEYFVNSEKDSGIYDAMNKGIEKATGDYIFFLNSGDWFYSYDIVEKVINAANVNELPDFIYGNIAAIERGMVKISYGDDSQLENNITVFHQGVFSSVELMKKNPFDLSHKIAADYHFILGQKLKNKTFLKIDEIFAYFAMDGVSYKNVVKCIVDREKIKKEYGLHIDKRKALREMIVNSIVVRLKSFIPQKLWEIWSVKIKGKNSYKE